MSLALHYRMRGAHHYSGPPVSEMTYTVSSGTLNSTIPYHPLPCVAPVLRRDFLPKPGRIRLAPAPNLAAVSPACPRCSFARPSPASRPPCASVDTTARPLAAPRECPPAASVSRRSASSPK